jgi:hypothetical protein
MTRTYVSNVLLIELKKHTNLESRQSDKVPSVRNSGL